MDTKKKILIMVVGVFEMLQLSWYIACQELTLSTEGLIIAILAGFCFMSVLFVAMPKKRFTRNICDAWLDLNVGGETGIIDPMNVGKSFGAEGYSSGSVIPAANNWRPVWEGPWLGVSRDYQALPAEAN
jgi:hypothetical protein